MPSSFAAHAALLVAVAAGAYLAGRSVPADFDAVDVTDYVASTGKVGPFAPNLALKTKVKPLLKGQLHAPETVWFGPGGDGSEPEVMFAASSHDGRVLVIDPVSNTAKTWAYTGGLPLAGHVLPRVAKQPDQYVAVGGVGLLLVNGTTRQSTILCNHVGDRFVTFADDLTVTSDGRYVYFTDASKFRPVYLGKDLFSGMVASQYDAMDGHKTGRVLRYDTATAKCTLVADGFWFANGIALSKDEKSLAVSETFGRKVWTIDIATGAKKPLTAEFPYIIDSMSEASDGGYWVAGIVPELGYETVVFPHGWLKNILVKLALVSPKHGTAVIKIDSKGTVLSAWQDDAAAYTSVTEHKGKLYLGNLAHDYIGVIDLTN